MPRLAMAWKRFVSEAVVIVAGILIALAVDAWWDNRQERSDEQVALGQLLAEFQDNAVQLDSVLTLHARELEATHVLLGLVRGSVVIGADSARSLVRVLDNPWTFNPKQGALESLVTSGRLGIIRDDGLRLELAAWPGLLEDYLEEEEGSRTYASTYQYEALSSRVNWGDIYGVQDGRPSRPLGDWVGDEELEGILAYRSSWVGDMLAEANLIEDSMDRIRRLLEANVSGGG